MIKFTIHQIQKRKRLIKFLIVGTSGIIANMLFLWIFRELLFFPLSLAGIIAIELSVINNFIWNNIWTFKAHALNAHWSSKFLKYQLSVLIGIGINYLTLIGLTKIGVFYLLSNLIGIGLSTASNYLLSSQWAWKNK
jgi:dolichol-phosphate mannosyltransferase